MPIRFVTSSDGVELCIRDFAGSGPTVLMVHAASFCGSVFGPLASALGPNYHSLAPDLRGHGSSSRPADLNYSWSRIGDDVAEILDEIDGPVFGFGHSLGGTALLLAAVRRPGRFDAICCYEPILLGGEDPHGSGEGQALGSERRIAIFPNAAAARERLGSRPPLDQLMPEALDAYLADGFIEEADDRVRLVLSPTDEAAIYRGARDADFDAEFSTITCPVTVLIGGGDGGRTLGATRLQRALPGANLLEIASCGHFGPLEHPDVITAAAINVFDTTTA